MHRESRLAVSLPSANMASWCTRPSEEARVAGRRGSADGEGSGKRYTLRASFYFAGLPSARLPSFVRASGTRKSRASIQEKNAPTRRGAAKTRDGWAAHCQGIVPGTIYRAPTAERQNRRRDAAPLRLGRATKPEERSFDCGRARSRNRSGKARASPPLPSATLRASRMTAVWEARPGAKQACRARYIVPLRPKGKIAAGTPALRKRAG